MASDGTETPNPPRFLEPPVVAALRQEARNNAPPSPSPMERTLSQDIREEREDLKEAAEHTFNVIVDLDLDGRVKWVSPSWSEVIGTPVEQVQGQLISEIVLDNKSVFREALDALKQDDSKSQIIRFTVQLGPSSVFWQDKASREEAEDSLSETGTSAENSQESNEPNEDQDENILSLEGQGIMVYDRSSGGDGHVSY